MTERVATVGIGWVPLASTASRFNSYIKLQYFNTAPLLRSSGVRASD